MNADMSDIEQEDMAPDFLCPFCRTGTMVPADKESDVPAYVCPVCGSYHGEFLHTGKIFYYTPLHLRVGRAIIARSGLGGPRSIPSLSVELSHEMGGDTSAEDVAQAIVYLEKNGVLEVRNGRIYAADSVETPYEIIPNKRMKSKSGETDGAGRQSDMPGEVN